MSAECGEPGPEGPQGPSPGPGGLPGASGLGQCAPRTTSAPWSLPLWRAHAAAAVLCYVNLLNYMHWFIIPGEGGEGVPGCTCCHSWLPATCWRCGRTAPTVQQTVFSWRRPSRSHPWRGGGRFQPGPNRGGRHRVPNSAPDGVYAHRCGG